MKSPFALLIILCLTGLVVSVLGLSVRQIPEKINANEGKNVSITCYIEADSRSGRILVAWLKNNLTVNSETFNTSMHQLLYSGNVTINASLHLHSVHPNHSGIYYCNVLKDIPTLEKAHGKGTHLYIENSSTIVTSPPLTVTSPPLTVSSQLDAVMIWTLSGLGILLLIICIAFVIHIYYKGDYRRDLRAEIAINDATHGSQHSVTPENVVYAAINVSTNRESIKSGYKNCAALVPATETCIEESVTYSEVHIKSKPKNEG